jgi:TRAP-type uncharacterized transport system fused permease subunit
MLDWVLKNVDFLITIGMFLFLSLFAIILAIEGKWEQLRAMAFKLILLAEAAYTGSKRGQEKFAAVFDYIYSLIPAWLKLFVSKDTAKKKLQEWYNEIKDYLDNNKCDDSVNGVNLFPP